VRRRLARRRARGRTRRKFIYGRTRAEVAEKLAAMLAQRQQGLLLAPERITVAAFLTFWLAEVVQPTTAPRTHATYAGIVRRYLIPHLGAHLLAQLTPAHVQQLLSTLTDQGLHPHTVQQVRRVLHRALNRALKWEYVPRNVAALTDPPRGTRRLITPLSVDQARALLAAIAGHRLETLYRLALAWGCARASCGPMWTYRRVAAYHRRGAVDRRHLTAHHSAPRDVQQHARDA
jgi:hypothetical protein